MHPFHDRYPIDARVSLAFKVTATPTEQRARVTTATHDEIVIAITTDAPLTATDLVVDHWYHSDTARVASDDADYDLEIGADTTLTDHGTTVNDWLGGLTETEPTDNRAQSFSSGAGKSSTPQAPNSPGSMQHFHSPPRDPDQVMGIVKRSQEFICQNWADGETPDPNNTLGFATGGAKDVQNFRDHITEGLLPHRDAVTYEGLFYDYYFDTGDRRDRDSLFYPTYSQAITAHPLTGEREHYISVGLASNLPEEMLERPPLDLVAVVDVSGSMDSVFTEYYYDKHGRQRDAEGDPTTRKIEAARDALAALTEHLRPEDRIGVVLYNDQTKVAKPIRGVQETDMDAVRDAIRELEATGSTDMEAGFHTAVDHLTSHAQTERDDRESRVLFFTDAMPNEGGTTVDALATAFGDAAAEGVLTSFIGVGIDANPELVDALSGIRGANHYFMQSADEFADRMVEEFPYMVTPLVFDITLTVEGEGYDIDAVYGSPNADATTGDVMQVETLFPSPSDDGKSRGGVVLVKIAEREGASEVRLSCSWEERDGTEDVDVIRVDMPDTTPEHFDTSAVRKAVLLARYGNLLRDWLADSATVSDDISADDEARDGRPLDPCPPGDVDEELNQWERQSAPLVVPDAYRERFTAFRDHVANELDRIGDPDLKQELDVLDTLAGA